MTLLSQTDRPTLSVTESVAAPDHHTAIEAVIDATAAKVGYALDVVEYDVAGPISNRTRNWPQFPPNADLYDVYLRWLKPDVPE